MFKNKFTKYSLLSFFTGIVIFTGVQAASANTITVTTLADGLKAFDNVCSLREAIQVTNAQSASASQAQANIWNCAVGSGTGNDTITIASNLASFTNGVVLNSELLITRGVTIQAPKVGAIQYDLIVDGGANESVFHLVPPSGGIMNVTLNHLIIKNAGDTSSSGAGGIFNDIGSNLILNDSLIIDNDSSSLAGGIYNKGKATLNNTSVKNNSGGGIRNAVDAIMTITGGTISGNTLKSGGAGIFNAGTLTLTSTTVSSNNMTGATNVHGGAGIATTGTLTVINSNISNNKSVMDGGAIYIGSGGGLPTVPGVTISGTTINNNIATNGYGGGIVVEGNAYVTIKKSTINNNQAPSGSGGAVAFTGSNVDANIENVTIVGNVAKNGGGIGVDDNGNVLVKIKSSTIAYNNATQDGGGIYRDYTSQPPNKGVTLLNTLVANNTASNSGTDCGGSAPLISNDYNLIGNTSGCSINTQSNDKFNVNPSLPAGPIALGSNGGPTKTVSLPVGSPAINAGPTVGTAPSLGLDVVDQRGFTRVQGLNYDIGAFEATSTGVFQFFETSNYGSEVSKKADIKITRTDGNTSAAASVNLVLTSTSTDNATPTADYNAATILVTFAPGVTTKIISVPIMNDALIEGTEKFTATLANPTNGTSIGYKKEATVNIIDDDLTNINFAVQSYTVNENAGSIDIGITVNGLAPNSSVTAKFATGNVTAIDGTNYTGKNGTVNFDNPTNQPVGLITKKFTVPIIDDQLPGPPTRQFTVTLSDPTGGATIPLIPIHYVTIKETTVGNPCVVQLNNVPTQVAENVAGGTVNIPISLTGTCNTAMTVHLTTSNDSAKSPTDYIDATQDVSFNPIFPNLNIPITIIDNNIADGSRTFNISLTPVSAGLVLGNPSTGTITILDDEVVAGCIVQLDTPPSQVAETAGSVDVTLKLAGTCIDPVTVHFGTMDGTANMTTTGTNPADYDDASKDVTLDQANPTVKVSVSIKNNQIVDGDRTINLSLSNPTNAVLGNPSVAVLTVNDDDLNTPCSVQLDTPPTQVAENVATGMIEIPLNLSGNCSGIVTVHFGTMDGTANMTVNGTNPADYNDGAQDVTIDSSVTTSGVAQIMILDNQILDGDRTLNIALSSPNGAVLGNATTSTLTIKDDEAPCTVQLSSATYSVSETAGFIDIPVEFNGVCTMGNVTLSTTDGTATSNMNTKNPADFDAVLTVINFDPNSLNQVISIPVNDNNVIDGSRMLQVILGTPVNVALGTPATAGVTINDDEVFIATTTVVQSSLNPAEVGQMVTFTAQVQSQSDNGPLTGTITFYNDGVQMEQPLMVNANGQATIQTSTLSQGIHNIRAIYNGDSIYAISTSADLLQSITGSTVPIVPPVVISPVNNGSGGGGGGSGCIDCGNLGDSYYGAGSSTTCGDYSDIPKTDPMCAEYEAGKKLGFTGYADGSKKFGPNDAFKRGEALKIVQVTSHQDFDQNKDYCLKVNPFMDILIGNDWMDQRACYGKQKGTVTGYLAGLNMGKFVPYGEVSQAEFAAMLLRNTSEAPALQKIYEQNLAAKKSWSAGYMDYIISHKLNVNQNANKLLSRSEALDMVYKFSQAGLLK